MREVAHKPSSTSVTIKPSLFADSVAELRYYPYVHVTVPALGVNLALSPSDNKPFDTCFVAGAHEQDHSGRRALCVRIEPSELHPFPYFVGIRLGEGPEYFIGTSIQQDKTKVLNEDKEEADELLIDEADAMQYGVEARLINDSIDRWQHGIHIRHGTRR